MSKKRVLVCGATGFIGRNVAERLARRAGYEVVGTYHRSDPPRIDGVQWVGADLTDRASYAGLFDDVDCVIQAAATTSGARDIVSRPYIHVTDNVVMNSLLFREAFESGVGHVVFFSCSVMYRPAERPVKESDFDANAEMVPSYFGGGWTKVYLEKMAEFFSRPGETRFTVIRHSNIYGPHDKFDLERSHVFGATVTKVLQATDSRITVWGDGSESRDLLHVSDLVDFVELAMDRQESRFELVNVGLGDAVSIDSLVRRIIAAAGEPVEIEYDPTKPTIKTRLALDSTRARQIFSWEPRVTLDEGIQKTIAWYRENLQPTRSNS